MYTRQELQAIATYYWHIRERGLASSFCLVRMADFSKCYGMLTIEEKRSFFRAIWLEDGSNADLLIDRMCDFLNGNV